MIHGSSPRLAFNAFIDSTDGEFSGFELCFL